MRRLLPVTLLLLISLLISGHSMAQNANPVRLIAKKDINTRAVLANSPDDNKLLLIWYQQKDAVEPFNNEINGVLLNDHTLKVKRRFNVSRPSNQFYFSPWFTVYYNRHENHYVVLYHQVSEEKRTLIMSTLNQGGRYIRRSFDLLDYNYPLMAPLLAMPAAEPGFLTLFFTGLEDDEIRSHALTFSSLRPISKYQTLFSWKGKNLFYLLPQAVVAAENMAYLYSFAQFPGRQEQRFVSRLAFENGRGFRGLTRKVTNARDIAGSTSLDAMADTEQFDDLEAVALAAAGEQDPLPQLEAGLFDPVTRTVVDRQKILPRDVNGLETVIMPATEDHLSKLVWIEQAGNQFALKVADLAQDMTIVPGSEVIVVEAGEPLLSDVAAVMTADGQRLVIAWSEHQDDGTARLLVRAVPL